MGFEKIPDAPRGVYERFWRSLASSNVSTATMYIGVVETFPDGAKLLETNTVPDGKRSEDSGIQGQNNTGQWDCGGY